MRGQLGGTISATTYMLALHDSVRELHTVLIIADRRRRTSNACRCGFPLCQEKGIAYSWGRIHMGTRLRS